MQNRWVAVSRVLLPLEGAAGMLSNGVLIFYLARAKMDRSARLYQISCVVSAAISFILALLEMIVIDSGELVDGFLIGVCYGPLLLRIPTQVADIICAAFLAQIHTLWQMVPAPSILQLLSLKNRPMSSLTRMALAYSAPLFFYFIGWIAMMLVISSPAREMREEMSISAIRVHGTNRSEFHAVGARLFDETRISVADIVVFDFIPSFTASYALFAISMSKIRAELGSLGGKLSAKTEQMQRRFFRLQIAQYPTDIRWIRERGAYHMEDISSSVLQRVFLAIVLSIVFAVVLTFALFGHMFYFLRTESNKGNNISAASIRKSQIIFFVQLLLPLSLISGPICLVLIGLLLLLSFEFLLAMMLLTTLHAIGHNTLLISLTPSYRKFILSPKSSLNKIFITRVKSY